MRAAESFNMVGKLNYLIEFFMGDVLVLVEVKICKETLYGFQAC